MKCLRIEKFLPLHVAGDLAGRRARAVSKHLTTCEACRYAADGYEASHKFVRAEADSLPTEFDSAFYAEIRNSVLAQIRQERTLPPPSAASALSAFFNPRLAYVASLVLIILAAALSLHNSTRRTNEEVPQQEMSVNFNSQWPVTPASTATSSIVRQERRDRQTPQPGDKFAGGKSEKERVAKPALAKRRTPFDSLRSGAQPDLMLTRYTPSNARRNPLVLTADGARPAIAKEIASRDITTALTEVSRIEIQTSDPNIRIIWLSPGPDSAQPLR